MLSDLLEKTTDLSFPNTDENFVQFKLSETKSPAVGAPLKRLYDLYLKIINNIANVGSLRGFINSAINNLINFK